MQQNVPAASLPAQWYDQQPPKAVVLDVEAIRTAIPSTFKDPRTVDREVYHPSAPLCNTPTLSVPIHQQYPNQTNYTRTPFPATTCTSPSTSATNADSPNDQTSEDCPGDSDSVPIIQPMPTKSSACCSGKINWGRGVPVGIFVLIAIIKTLAHSTDIFRRHY